MTRRFTTLAWAAAACTYLLIVLGAVVRITGSGLGCGEHWPLCNGHLFPPLNDIRAGIEWSHRLVAPPGSVMVVGLAARGWVFPGRAPGVRKAARVASGLLAGQGPCGAIPAQRRGSRAPYDGAAGERRGDHGAERVTASAPGGARRCRRGGVGERRARIA